MPGIYHERDCWLTTQALCSNSQRLTPVSECVILPPWPARAPLIFKNMIPYEANKIASHSSHTFLINLVPSHPTDISRLRTIIL